TRYRRTEYWRTTGCYALPLESSRNPWRTRNINCPEDARGRIAGQGTQWNRHHADGDESSRICLESFHLSIPSERSQLSLPTSASSAAADKSIRTTFFTQSGWRRWILV